MDPDDPELMLAKSLTNKEIAESLAQNAEHAKTDIMEAIIIVAAEQLRGGDTEAQTAVLPPPIRFPLRAVAVAE